MQLEIKPEILNLIPVEQASYYKIIPFELENNSLKIYCTKDFLSNNQKDEVELILDKRIEVDIKDSDWIQKALNKYYLIDNSRQALFVKQQNISWQATDLIEQLVREARSFDSSDIHLEIFEDKARLRLRIDGKLIEKYTIGIDIYPSVINRIKVQARLDISEKRLPQDGRISIKNNKENLDVRVSVLPGMYGEKVVLRILGKNASYILIDNIGFDANDLKEYMKSIQKANGIVLVSGPTGSGKTTTLYATLNYLNKPNVNILTIEDPVEYTLEGVNQVQVKEDIGFTFSKALRTFLRQDPDIIMFGEIRDKETADMAVRASLTGHLVLSTIHTNSCLSTISRLVDMDVPSFLIAETLNISVAQRLIRTLCNNCKKPIEIDKIVFQYRIDFPEGSYFEAGGCNECFHTGYKGRMAIFEMFTNNEKNIELIKKNDILALKESTSIRTLATKCISVASQGLTSVEEIYPLLLNEI